MSEFKVPAQADESGAGLWVFIPVKRIVDEGSTFSNGNPGGRVVAECEHFPGVGQVKLSATVHLKQPKGKQGKQSSADPAAMAAAVLAILQGRGVDLSALLPGGGQAVSVPPGTSGADLSAGRAAAAALLAASTAASGSTVEQVADRPAAGNVDALPVPPAVPVEQVEQDAAESAAGDGAGYQAVPAVDLSQVDLPTGDEQVEQVTA